MALDKELIDQVQKYAEVIHYLAKKVVSGVNVDSDLKRMAAHRASRPIDYMRYAEFGAVLPLLQLKAGSIVLDAGGPQWLTFALAYKNPEVQFEYINLSDFELEPFEKIRSFLKLENISINKEDLRKLSFSDNKFDEILSISVIEHIYPEIGGDETAFGELKRVLKPEGNLIVTIPCKETANVVYVQGNVYERQGEKAEKQFFAREYSPQSLRNLLGRAEFSTTEFGFISEKPSISSIDYLEWGPLRGTKRAKVILKLFRGIERYCNIPIEKNLATNKLSLSSAETPRLVNAVILARKSSQVPCTVFHKL